MKALREQDLLARICQYLPERIKNAVENMGFNNFGCLEEIRIKAGIPLMGVFNGYDRFISQDGRLLSIKDDSLIVSVKEIEELFIKMCEHSVYAYQEDISRGFITLKGGHRAGICGTVVYQGDSIKYIKEISSVCIRISRQFIGCAQQLFLHIKRGDADIYNTLILSPPRCGKTTILRDLCRIISEGSQIVNFNGLRTVVIDERSEIAACYRGIPQNDLGSRTDVLDGCRKPEGIEMVLRGMAPSVIIVDELGAKKDADSIKMAWNAGVRILATAHAYDLEDFKGRMGIGGLAGKNGFERYAVLSMNQGKREVRVMDENGYELNADNKADGVCNGFCGMHGNRDEAVCTAQGEAACAY